MLLVKNGGEVMNGFKSGLAAAFLMIAAASPSAALTSAEVLNAIDVRVDEISVQIAGLEVDLGAAPTQAAAAAIRSQIQILTVRQAQLINAKDVVPNYNEQALFQFVTHHDLDVSPA